MQIARDRKPESPRSTALEKKLNLQNAFETQDRTLQLPYRYHSLLLYNIKIDIK